MALESFQEQLQLNRLYESQVGYNSAVDQIKPNLYINSGSVNIYGSNSATQPITISAMALPVINENVSGLFYFEIVPKYIAIIQHTGTTTEIVTSGIESRNLGAIA